MKIYMEINTEAIDKYIGNRYTKYNGSRYNDKRNKKYIKEGIICQRAMNGER